MHIGCPKLLQSWHWLTYAGAICYNYRKEFVPSYAPVAPSLDGSGPRPMLCVNGCPTPTPPSRLGLWRTGSTLVMEPLPSLQALPDLVVLIEQKSWSSSFWWSFAEVNMAFIVRLCSLPPFAVLFVCLDVKLSPFYFSKSCPCRSFSLVVTPWPHRLSGFLRDHNLRWDLLQGFVKWVPHWVLKLLECFCVFLGNVRHWRLYGDSRQ